MQHPEKKGWVHGMKPCMPGMVESMNWRVSTASSYGHKDLFENIGIWHYFSSLEDELGIKRLIQWRTDGRGGSGRLALVWNTPLTNFHR